MRRFRRLLRRLILLGAAVYASAILLLAALRWIDPPTTAVQVQRRVESLFEPGHYRKQYRFVPLERIDADLRHAVIAAEDSRFYQHWGFDWQEVRHVIEEGESRGASTITQQLVKNLLLCTHRSRVRKAIEATLVPPAELLLGKRRILELYLNVVEWGPGIYGAEAAAQLHYHTSSATLSRDQAARLAALLPAPRRRAPGRVDSYSGIIQQRMRAMGW
jgi:monofunctional biosynthetic peptidoglycan transglycosylase